MAVLMVLAATPAFADATAFLGNISTPTNRMVKGVAIGLSVLIVGIEFEYADSGEEFEEGTPSLRTGMGNVLVQTPFPVAGMQFYGTIGAGAYRERLAGTLATPLYQETNVGINTGGGVKISLLGPLRARVDYRLFKLRGDPQNDTVHRVYAGINLGF